MWMTPWMWRVARVLEEVLSPAHIAIGLPILICVAAVHPWWIGLAWAAVAATGCGIIPYALILRGVRTGRLGDRHIYAREQRAAPLVSSMVSVLVTLGVLLLGSAPAPVVAIVAAALSGLVWVLALTVGARWKVSVHAGVAGGAAVALLWLEPDPFMRWVVVLLAGLVGWSRVYTRSHTPGQVCAGLAMGALVSGGIFTFIVSR